MKKIITLFLSAVLMLSCCLTANAAETTVTVSAAGSATVDSSIEFTVALNGCADATSVAVDVSFGDKFELVSGSWLKAGQISSFDTAKKKGALGGLSSPNINGNLFKLILKVKTADATAQSVNITVIAKKRCK